MILGDIRMTMNIINHLKLTYFLYFITSLRLLFNILYIQINLLKEAVAFSVRFLVAMVMVVFNRKVITVEYIFLLLYLYNKINK